jgi:hypothetical protein
MNLSNAPKTKNVLRYVAVIVFGSLRPRLAKANQVIVILVPPAKAGGN